MVGFSDLTQPHHYSGGGFGIMEKRSLSLLAFYFESVYTNHPMRPGRSLWNIPVWTRMQDCSGAGF